MEKDILIIQEMSRVWGTLCQEMRTETKYIYYTYITFPLWLRWERICLQCRRPGFDPWLEKIPWRRKWEPSSQNTGSGNSSILDWRIPWTEETGKLQSMELQRVWHNWQTNTFTFFSYIYYTSYIIVYVIYILNYILLQHNIHHWTMRRWTMSSYTRDHQKGCH